MYKTSSEKKSNYQNLKVVIYQTIIRKNSKPYGLQVGNIVYKIRVDNEYFYFYSEYFGSIPYILKKTAKCSELSVLQRIGLLGVIYRELTNYIDLVFFSEKKVQELRNTFYGATVVSLY